MRMCVLLVLGLILPACGDDKGSNPDLAAASSDLSAQADDGGSAVDLRGGTGDGGYSSDGGVAGAACTSACDCTPGLGCFGGKCVATNKPVYCCGGTPCPAGDLCESSGGNFGRCGSSGGMADLAKFDFCPLVDCSNGPNGNKHCMDVGCTMCVANGNGGMSCSK